MNELITQDGNLTMTAEKAIFRFKEQMKELKRQEEEFNAALLKEMEKRGILSFKDENMTIIRLAATQRETFDTKAFKAKFPDIYKKYIKTSDVKPSVRVTLKKGITSENMVKDTTPEVQMLEIDGEW